MIDQIVEYIRQYRDTYSREAIDSRLLAAGYSSEQVSAAWAQLASEDANQPSQGYIPTPPNRTGWGDESYTPPKKERVANRPIFWASLVGLIVLSYALPALLLYLSGLSSYNQGLSTTLGWLALASFGALQIASIIGGLLALNRNRPLGLGLLYGVLMTVVVLPFTALFILLGICLTGLVTV